MTFLVYLYLAAFIIFDIVILTMGLEQMICFFNKMAPEVPSSAKLRQAIVEQIKADIPDAKTILDIGSGWGTMLRAVAAAFPAAHVTGAEIMPSPYIYSSIRCGSAKNVEIVFGNVFKHVKKDNRKFDVGIAYLLTPMMKKVQQIRSHFKVLMVLDFPLPDIAPDKKIMLHQDRLGQHCLYVYKK
ncbi:MAG: hypothetical protein LBF28_00750 [Rickettsiales bacterium]|jgi:hypothetical protein|nr:hypothetical protein [Rickettsiales bacterium]